MAKKPKISFQIENKKKLNFFFFFELEEILSKSKKYYDHYDIEYKGIREVQDLFNQTDEDYYKPIKTTSVFDNKNNYIEYESK